MKSVLHRTHRNSKYTTINLSCIEDPTISWAAKAVHFYAMSRPPGWELRTQDLIDRSTDGRAKLYGCLTELIEGGYLRRSQEMIPQQTEDGKPHGTLRGRTILDWYEESQGKTPHEDAIVSELDVPNVGIPKVGIPKTVTHSKDQGSINQDSKKHGGEPPRQKPLNPKAEQARLWGPLRKIYRDHVDADTADACKDDDELLWRFVDCHDAQVQAGKYTIQDVIDRIAELVKWSWTNPAVEDLMDARHEAYCADHRGYVRDMAEMAADRARVEASHAQVG